MVGFGSPVASTNARKAVRAVVCVSYGFASPQSRSSQKALNHFAFCMVRPSIGFAYLAHPKYASNPWDINPSTTPSISSAVSTNVCLGTPFFSPTTQYIPSDASTAEKKEVREVIVRSQNFRTPAGDGGLSYNGCRAFSFLMTSCKVSRIVGWGNDLPKNHRYTA